MAFDASILRHPELGFVFDYTHVPVPSVEMGPALAAMERLERGAIANADEGRMVGHYWLREPALAPTDEIGRQIREATAAIGALDAGHFHHVVMIGIGGSALGPQLVHDCLSSVGEAVSVHFLDNTDPDGHAAVLAPIELSASLFVVISKSGGTVEMNNGMAAARRACDAAHVGFDERAIAITAEGSQLHQLQAERGWLATFPMWDWVGGRTSVTGPVGLVMMALTGRDVSGFLEGARRMDVWTRAPQAQNPAALLAAIWFEAGRGVGARSLVIEPYRDRFQLFSRYLQQLVMESVGKETDRGGNRVHQGLTVYGNKGSTDQHAFVQQLRDGTDNALVHFIETFDAGDRRFDPEATSADTLLGLRMGTEIALTERERPSIVVGVPDASARSLGALIALFERAVGLYAELIDINAYHQPGVEAGKRSAKAVLEVLSRLEWALGDEPATAAVLAERVDEDPRTCWRLLDHLAATGRASLQVAGHPREDCFSRSPS